MAQSSIEKAIEALEHVRQRPGMYFNNETEPVESFIIGFTLAIQLFDPNGGAHQDTSIWQELGFQSNRSPYAQLKERGADEEDIVAMYLSSVIEYYKRLNS
jgi:hypothetical protein